MLDSVRAALSANSQRLANMLIIAGQSQGSGPALGATRISPAYAADINLVATIVTGVTPSFPAVPYQQHEWMFTAQGPFQGKRPTKAHLASASPVS